MSTGCTRGLIPSRSRDLFLLSLSSDTPRLALGPSQPPIKLVLGDLTLEIKQMECGDNLSPLANAQV